MWISLIFIKTMLVCFVVRSISSSNSQSQPGPWRKGPLPSPLIKAPEQEILKSSVCIGPRFSQLEGHRVCLAPTLLDRAKQGSWLLSALLASKCVPKCVLNSILSLPSTGALEPRKQRMSQEFYFRPQLELHSLAQLSYMEGKEERAPSHWTSHRKSGCWSP